MQLQRLLALATAVALTSASPLGARKPCPRSTASTTTAAAIASASASPSASAAASASAASAAPAAVASGSSSIDYTLPSDVTLPSPGDLTLQYIAVGHGIQNYTCTAAGASATSFGALAVLWDITALYPGTSGTGLSDAAWANLTSVVLRTTAEPLNLANDGGAAAGASATAPFPDPTTLSVDGVADPLAFLGHHFFDVDNVPTFDLSSATPDAAYKGAKTGDVAAPAGADAGLGAEGAVDWLQLSPKTASADGVQMVYRVLTAGGDGSTCTAAGEAQSVQYAAQYWFYV
ncbi:hypothetical protein GGR56DRAFT_604637 [Xylariaceae sp. FL0804]|nr:hypothetical protein GGR56DRAFT_604637 [Xylariaceae sp. FL0804]